MNYTLKSRIKKSSSLPSALDFTELKLENLQFASLKELDKYLVTADNFKLMKYSRDQIRNYLNNPDRNEKNLRQVSRYLYISSSHYYRLINYFSNMLTLDSILIPLDSDKISKSAFKNAYIKVTKYIENYNLKSTLLDIIGILLLEDVYYGVERWNGDAFLLQRLPSDYCKITNIENGLYTFSMDMSYFDTKKTDINSQPLDIIKQYPKEFTTLFRQYKSTNMKWQPIPSEYGVCFKLNKSILTCFPPFVQIYEEIMDIEDQKELRKTNAKTKNFRLIQQKIPFKKEPKSEKDFIITLPSVKMYHNAIKQALPPGIAIVSSPMDLTAIDFEKKVGSQTYDDINAEDQLFNKAGVAKPLFAGGENNAVTLNRSIEMDATMMFSVLRQFEVFFKQRLNSISSTYKFKLVFPNITSYNQKDMLKDMLTLGQSGFPKSLAIAVAGYSLTDIYSLNELENNYLKLIDNMLPLQSSHTQGDAGRPELDDGELSPSGEKNKTTGADDKRGKS